MEHKDWANTDFHKLQRVVRFAEAAAKYKEVAWLNGAVQEERDYYKGLAYRAARKLFQRAVFDLTGREYDNFPQPWEKDE